MDLRKFGCGIAVAVILTIVTAMQMQNSEENDMVVIAGKEVWPFSLPKLPYNFDALEPSIDAKTVDIHYSRHHKAYVDNLNKAVGGTSWQSMTLNELFAHSNKLPTAIRNNAGGHWNHTFYWSIMRSAENNPGPSPKLMQEFAKNFGSFEAFKEGFKEAGLKTFGSGWAWLVRMPNGSMQIWSSPNQDNPLMDMAEIKPLLTCDVWEHAYYLKYLNRRDEYMDSFWNIVNWDRVEELFAK